MSYERIAFVQIQMQNGACVYEAGKVLGWQLRLAVPCDRSLTVGVTRAFHSFAKACLGMVQ